MASAIVKEEHDHSDNTLQAELNPRTINYEFMGPAGAFLITLAIPAVTYLLYFGCSERAGGCPPAHLFPSYPSLHDAVSSGNTADAVELVKTSAGIIGESLKVAVTDPEWWKGLWDPKAALMYAAWYAFCVVSWAVLPGDEVEGTVLRTGGRQKYKINGECFLTSNAVLNRDTQRLLSVTWIWTLKLLLSSSLKPNKSLGRGARKCALKFVIKLNRDQTALDDGFYTARVTKSLLHLPVHAGSHLWMHLPLWA